MLTLVKENIITFTRLPYSICKGYNVIITEDVNGKEVVSREYIENPKVPLIVKERVELEYNAKLKWELPRYITTTSSDTLKVWVNNVELDIKSYTYSPSLRMLSINSDISEKDLIEAEYTVDRIEIIKNTQNDIQIKVYPVYNESHKIGQHSVI